MEARLARHALAILEMVVVRALEAFVSLLAFDRRHPVLFPLVGDAFLAIPMEADDASAAAVGHAFIANPMEADHASAAALLLPALLVGYATIAIPVEADHASAAAFVFLLLPVGDAFIAVPVEVVRASEVLVPVSPWHAFTVLMMEAIRATDFYLYLEGELLRA
jgi:hypothetical protein